MTKHLVTAATAETIARADMYATVTVACGASVNAYKAQTGATTTDRELVTCKRCAKVIETGTADTGILAAYRR